MWKISFTCEGSTIPMDKTNDTYMYVFIDLHLRDKDCQFDTQMTFFELNTCIIVDSSSGLTNFGEGANRNKM